MYLHKNQAYCFILYRVIVNNFISSVKLFPVDSLRMANYHNNAMVSKTKKSPPGW